MAEFIDFIVDTNGDGILDDVQALLVAGDEAGEQRDRAYWSAFIDLAAMTGLETEALTFPLARTATDQEEPDERQRFVLGSVEEINGRRWSWPADPLTGADASQPVSRCLSALFSPSGALDDRDGDLIADHSRITFQLPDHMPQRLGVALANLAARLGLESTGITLPLCRPGSTQLRIQPLAGEARLETAEEGWTISGSPESMAALIDNIATNWPHVTSPVTAGVQYSLGWLRRSLAGDGPEPNGPGELAWEMQWSGEPEVKRLRQTLADWVVPALDRDLPLEVTVFASEPVNERRVLASTLRRDLEQAGFAEPKVTVLNAFKAGLCWLREIVIPALREEPCNRVEISYQRYEHDGGPGEALDLPIRWLQELFPADELIARDLGLATDAVRIIEAGPEQEATYVARGFVDSRRVTGRWECSLLHTSQPYIPAFPETGNVRVTTGGIIARQGDREIRRAVDTDMERFWRFYQREVLRRIMRDVLSSGGPAVERQPFFGELLVEVWISEQNEELGIREENVSGAEALHEDIYFNTLDTLEVFGVEVEGEVTSAPGAVIPIVHVVPGGAPHARVQLRAARTRELIPRPEVAIQSLQLVGGEFQLGIQVEPTDEDERLQRRLTELARMRMAQAASVPARVTVGDHSELIRLPLQEVLTAPVDGPVDAPAMMMNLHGDAVLEQARVLTALPTVNAWIEERSWAGLPIIAMSLANPTGGRLRSAHKAAALRPGCLVVARHHANEISSTNAAFQLAFLTGTDPAWATLLQQVNVTLLPYENPDGAALHARLAADPTARHWKHHPARYNATGYEFAGDFFNPETVFGESRARPAVWRRFLPDVIVDNHGVPSHEWVQPFAGFGSPPRFQVSYWIPQALIYGILRYVDDPQFPEHQDAARSLRRAVTLALKDTDIDRLNREIGASYRFWGQAREPEAFPGEFHQQMLWHVAPVELDPEGRGFTSRYPKTTVVSWVTEVNDETATGEHLERVARAHLLANRAMLELMAAAAPATGRWSNDADGVSTIRIGRDRPLRLHSEYEH